MANERTTTKERGDRATRIMAALDAAYEKHRQLVVLLLSSQAEFYGRFDLSVYCTAGELTQQDVSMKHTTKIAS